MRDVFVRQRELTLPFCRDIVARLQAAIDAAGRDHPVPKLSQRKLERLAKEAAVAAAVEEQAREAVGLAALQACVATANPLDASSEGRGTQGAAGGAVGEAEAEASCGAVTAELGGGDGMRDLQLPNGAGAAASGAARLHHVDVKVSVPGHDRCSGDACPSGAESLGCGAAELLGTAPGQQQAAPTSQAAACEVGSDGAAVAAARPAKQARLQSACV